jgi:type II secretory pathway predicted ATPase ExeA
MYHARFGLREEPFGVTPDPRFFFQTPGHSEAVGTLFYAIQQRRGSALLVGRAGLGKTSVLLTLVGMLQDKAQIAYLANPYYNHATVLDTVLRALGLEPAATPDTTRKLFHEYLLRTHASRKTVVIIFDEAQDLSRDTLEAIRMLSNFETPTEKLVQIVVAGQPRLAATLRQPDCEQIRQRFSGVFSLEPLSGPEVNAYIAYRLQTAGGSIALFSPEAIKMIADASGGVPRNINTICFNSLTLAFALERDQASTDEVTEVLRDLDLPGSNVEPRRPASLPKPTEVSAELPRSFRSGWIGAGVVLLAVCASLLGTRRKKIGDDVGERAGPHSPKPDQPKPDQSRVR